MTARSRDSAQPLDELVPTTRLPQTEMCVGGWQQDTFADAPRSRIEKEEGDRLAESDHDPLTRILKPHRRTFWWWCACACVVGGILDHSKPGGAGKPSGENGAAMARRLCAVTPKMRLPPRVALYQVWKVQERPSHLTHPSSETAARQRLVTCLC